mmetsp:Transcript_14576/g.57230  ORF Transcript_14576/g.57230 Transcript_14576/m.57230 type:complete len:296 (+) Transcript_14576:330-1217(+)
MVLLEREVHQVGAATSEELVVDDHELRVHVDALVRSTALPLAVHGNACETEVVISPEPRQHVQEGTGVGIVVAVVWMVTVVIRDGLEEHAPSAVPKTHAAGYDRPAPGHEWLGDQCSTRAYMRLQHKAWHDINYPHSSLQRILQLPQQRHMGNVLVLQIDDILRCIYRPLVLLQDARLPCSNVEFVAIHCRCALQLVPSPHRPLQLCLTELFVIARIRWHQLCGKWKVISCLAARKACCLDVHANDRRVPALHEGVVQVCAYRPSHAHHDVVLLVGARRGVCDPYTCKLGLRMVL